MHRDGDIVMLRWLTGVEITGDLAAAAMAAVDELNGDRTRPLLVDMSGSVTESGDVPVIVQASHAFSDRVSKYQKVAVYAFDGSPEIHPISGWQSSASGIVRPSTFAAFILMVSVYRVGA